MTNITTPRRDSMEKPKAKPKKAKPRSSLYALWRNKASKRLVEVLVCVDGCVGSKKSRQKSSSKRKVRLTAEVEVVDSKEMIKLNHRFRGKNQPTDVLSFSSPQVFREFGYLGDLVVCLPVLKKQAAEFKHAPASELDVLLVHGVLHLMGFDHEKSAKEAKKMQKLEAQVLEALQGSFGVKKVKGPKAAVPSLSLILRARS